MRPETGAMGETPRPAGRVLRYALGPADRLAFAVLPRELTLWEKLRLLVIVGVAGLLAGMLPEDMGRLAWWASVAAILVVGGAGAILWSNIEVRRKAAALAVPDGAVELEDCGDHLAEHSADGVRSVSGEDIAQVVATASHVFVRAGDRPLIVPAAAFADRAEMEAFAQRWDTASRDAMP